MLSEIKNNLWGGSLALSVMVSVQSPRGEIHNLRLNSGGVSSVSMLAELIEDLWTYMDVSFGIEVEGNLVWYHRYQKYMPTNQVKLLSL